MGNQNLNQIFTPEFVQECFQKSIDGIMIVQIVSDAPLRVAIVYANPSLCKLTGYDELELLNASPKIFQGEKTAFPSLQRINEAIKKKLPIIETVLNYKKDRSFFWNEISISPLDEKHWLYMMRDVTPIKTLELELKQKEKTLNLIMESTYEGIWEWDMNSGKIFWSSKVYELFGIHDHSMDLNMNLLIRMIHPEDLEKMNEARVAHIKKKTDFIVEARFRKLNGAYSTFLMKGKAEYDEENHPIRMVGIISDITEKKEAEEYILSLAYTDNLTGLYNRLYLEEKVEQLLEDKSTSFFSIAFLDLDRFKPVNDTYGHEIGDKVLQEISNRIQYVMGAENPAARFGGDEFVILITSAQKPKDAVILAMHCLETISQKLYIDGHEIEIGASLGISFFPFDGRSFKELIRNADERMYDEKINSIKKIEAAKMLELQNTASGQLDMGSSI